MKRLMNVYTTSFKYKRLFLYGTPHILKVCNLFQIIGCLIAVKSSKHEFQIIGCLIAIKSSKHEPN